LKDKLDKNFNRIDEAKIKLSERIDLFDKVIDQIQIDLALKTTQEESEKLLMMIPNFCTNERVNQIEYDI